MNSDMDGALWNAQRVAQHLGLKVPRVWALARQRRLRAVRIGRLMRFSAKEIQRFIERNSEPES